MKEKRLKIHLESYNIIYNFSIFIKKYIYFLNFVCENFCYNNAYEPLTEK